MSEKREIEQKITELNGRIRNAENEREHYSRETDKYKDDMNRFSMLARQKEGIEKEEFQSKYSHAQIDYVDAMKRYSEWRDEVSDLQAQKADLERERDGSGPGGGPGKGPPPVMAIAELTPEKKKELEQDKTRKIRGPDLGDDFGDM